MAAESLFEAIAVTVDAFRKDDWCGRPPDPRCEFAVARLPEMLAVTYKFSIGQVEEFAVVAAARAAKGAPRAPP